MTKTLKDMMAARAEAAPGPHIDIDGVIGRGRRRVWRNRVAGGSTACAALVALALVAPMLADWSGGSEDETFTGSLGGVSYATGSTIHDGNTTIDVSPHVVTFYVQTDDGFVYVARDGGVYFTDGGESERIGRSGGDPILAADDSGSLVGWTEVHGTEDPEPDVVVYDTAKRAEVFRTSEAGGDGHMPPLVMALDDGVVYVRDDRKPYTAPAWDVATRQPVRSSLALQDVSDGYIARDYWANTPESPRIRTVVSRDPDADTPRFPELNGETNSSSDLSPSGRYILSDVYPRRGEGFRQVVIERATHADVTPDVAGYAHEDPAYWIDDDRYVLEGYHGINDGTSERDLLVCSVSAEACEVATSVKGEVLFPTGW